MINRLNKGTRQVFDRNIWLKANLIWPYFLYFLQQLPPKKIFSFIL